MPDDPRYPCDGSDDPAQRCGRHHATGLASLYGGYQCCCGQPWRGGAKVCFTGEKAGDPVVADDPRPTPDDLDLLEMVGSRLEAAQVRDVDGVAALVIDVVSPVLERLRADLEKTRTDREEEARVARSLRTALDQARDERDDVLAKVERLRADLAEAQADNKSLGDRLYYANADATRAEAELATERASGVEYRRQIGYLAADVQQAEAERDTLRGTLAESDLGAQVLAQWEAIAAADADRDRLEAERDALKATLARTRTTWSEWYGRLGGAFPPAMVQEMDAALDASSAPESPCPRCDGSRFEPGTEAEGDWDPAAMRHHPYTGEPCTACNGTGKASGWLDQLAAMSLRAAKAKFGPDGSELCRCGNPDDCSCAPESPQNVRPISVASPGNDGFRYEPEEGDA